MKAHGLSTVLISLMVRVGKRTSYLCQATSGDEIGFTGLLDCWIHGEGGWCMMSFDRL